MYCIYVFMRMQICVLDLPQEFDDNVHDPLEHTVVPWYVEN